MKLRTRIFFSYFTVVVLTLAFLGWLIDTQVQRHVNDFYQAIEINGVEIITGPRRAAPPPREDFLKLLDHSIFLTALGAGFFAFLFSLAVTAHVTRPIQDVIRATRDIAQGNYKKRLIANSNDELGELTGSLNSMAASLEKNRYLQDQLILNVTHELATPLTNISGYLEALNDNMIRGNKKETYQLMKEEADRLQSMIQDLRSFEILKNPRFKLNLKKEDIVALTQRVMRQVQARFDQKKVNLTLATNFKKKLLALDKDRFTQILLNLLNNALQHTAAQKSVTLQLSSTDTQVELKIEDEGSGIPPKDLPFIFERFYRADASRSRETGGIGVGLSIVKELVQAHGGTITAESEEGKGARFTLLLPL